MSEWVRRLLDRLNPSPRVNPAKGKEYVEDPIDDDSGDEYDLREKVEWLQNELVKLKARVGEIEERDKRRNNV